MRSVVLMAAVLSAATGCGGGSSNQPPPVAVNVAPSVSTISDISVSGNGNASATFSVTDDRTDASDLQISIDSSPERLLPAANVMVSADGENRTLELAPVLDELGTAQVSLSVRDGEGLTTTQTFNVSVVAREVAVASFARELFQADADATPSLVNTLSITNDAQDDDFADLLVE